MVTWENGRCPSEPRPILNEVAVCQCKMSLDHAHTPPASDGHYLFREPSAPPIISSPPTLCRINCAATYRAEPLGYHCNG